MLSILMLVLIFVGMIVTMVGAQMLERYRGTEHKGKYFAGFPITIVGFWIFALGAAPAAYAILRALGYPAV